MENVDQSQFYLHYPYFGLYAPINEPTEFLFDLVETISATAAEEAEFIRNGKL